MHVSNTSHTNSKNITRIARKIITRMHNRKITKNLTHASCSNTGTLSGIPQENLVTLDSYVDSLKRNDFKDVHIIEQFEVGSGFHDFMIRHEKEWSDVVRSNRMASLRRAAWFISKCPIEMCIVSATR